MTTDLRGRAVDAAETLHDSGAPSTGFDDRGSANLGNGEGVVGYQYLHGSNANVGGFHCRGTAEIERRDDGTSTVTIETRYTWNDVIDPNPQYASDVWKSTVAEIGTLGMADPFDIHISWSETTVLELDASGAVTSMRNVD